MKKKAITFLVIIVIAAALIGVIYSSSVLKGKEIDEDKHLVLINYSELETKINNKESFILLISQSDCAHCLAFKPGFKEVLAKYDITAYEIQTDQISNEENNKLKLIANISGTPTTVFIVDGEEANTANRLVGEATKTKIESRLKAMGYIK